MASNKNEYGLAHIGLLLMSLVIVVLLVFSAWRVFSGGGEKNHPNLAQPQTAQNNEPQKDKNDIYPQVWTKNGYDGPSYEFKVNCGSDYQKLKECFLWNLSKVVVVDPKGKSFKLAKDFNANSYSGEITRRWVLYGEPNAGFPKTGDYTFKYYKNGKLIYQQKVTYQPNVLAAPTNITWKRMGNDLYVDWTAPKGIKEGDTYKVIIFRKNEVLSQLEQWDATSAVLKNLPLDKGEAVDMNVSSYFDGGYAYPESVKIAWE